MFLLGFLLGFLLLNLEPDELLGLLYDQVLLYLGLDQRLVSEFGSADVLLIYLQLVLLRVT